MGIRYAIQQVQELPHIFGPFKKRELRWPNLLSD